LEGKISRGEAEAILKLDEISWRREGRDIQDVSVAFRLAAVLATVGRSIYAEI